MTAADHARAALAPYWPRGEAPLRALPIAPAAPPAREPLPPVTTLVPLPDWAADIAADGGLLVPAWAVVGGEGAAWKRTDWWGAAGWYLGSAAERAHEATNGPIHGNARRLAGWDARLWRRAWVNRMALFLRRWAARRGETDETALLGPPPEAEVAVTHDVDAVVKTAAIRLKQAGFHAFNAARRLARRRPAMARAAAAARMLLGPGDYWCFDTIMGLEARRGRRSRFHFFAGRPGPWRSPRRALFDPAYDIAAPRLATMVRRLLAEGWEVGLHQSFDAWADAAPMSAERRRLEAVAGHPVTACRQHWLRFSFARTWAAQAKAGLTLDASLGFNDRPGFRNGAALAFQPPDPGGRPLPLTAVPLVLMDSHLYDYGDLDAPARLAEIAHWLGEVRAVGGTASVVWHQRVMHPDYGWGEGYEALLDTLDGRP